MQANFKLRRALAFIHDFLLSLLERQVICYAISAHFRPFLCVQQHVIFPDKGGGRVGQFLIFGWQGGEGGSGPPPFLADIICEQPLMTTLYFCIILRGNCTCPLLYTNHMFALPLLSVTSYIQHRQKNQSVLIQYETMTKTYSNIKKIDGVGPVDNKPSTD